MSKLTNDQIVALFIRTCEEATVNNIANAKPIIYNNKYSNLYIFSADEIIFLKSYNSTLVTYVVQDDTYILNQSVANTSNTSRKHRALFLNQVPTSKVVFVNYNTMINMDGTIQKKLKRARSENTIKSILGELKELYNYIEYLDESMVQDNLEDGDKLQQEIVKLFFSKGKELR